MNIEKTLENLKKNEMEAFFVKTKEEAKALALSMIPEGAVCASGGSVTLNELGILDELRAGNYEYLDRYAEGITQEGVAEVFRKSASCDVYLSSSNAITEDGELYNVDGNSNRVSSLLFGPKKVIFIAGKNKIVETLDDAIVRVKTVAAPLNAKRLGCKTYCAEKGHCKSLDFGGSFASGCSSPQRICCNFTVMAKQRNPERVKVIIVDENLGY